MERLKHAAGSTEIVVATHYYNPDDDRAIKGVQNEEEVKEFYGCPENAPEMPEEATLQIARPFFAIFAEEVPRRKS